MPTKTKPRAPYPSSVRTYVEPLDAETRTRVAALLGVSSRTALRSIREIEVVRGRLHGAREKAKSEPLAANLAAEFRPVMRGAERLAEQLKAMPNADRVLGTKEVACALRCWVQSAEQTVEFAEFQQKNKGPSINTSSGGSRARRTRKASESHIEALQQIYRRDAKAPTARSERAFLRLISK